MIKVIPPGLAKAQHGISALHHEMENHELRFRLKHTSGSAYILTKATAGSGWQKSHYHEVVRETYIVESGWMAFAELLDGWMRVRIFANGAVLTTQPNVVHNVYLPDGAIIHTVKHGGGEGDDRHTDGDAPALDLLTCALSNEAQIRAAAYRSGNGASYPEGYRHFDGLIWQVPAWSTAIFALACPIVIDAARLPVGGIAEQNSAGLVVFLSICLMVFGLVLYRFRVHQRSMKAYPSTPLWKSAQSWTQAMVAAQYSVLLTTGLDLLALSRGHAILAGMIIGFGSWTAFEWLVRRERIKAD